MCRGRSPEDEINSPIFLRTGNELTTDEQIKIAQLTAEALSHLAKAEALLEKMHQRRMNWISTELNQKIF